MTLDNVAHARDNAGMNTTVVALTIEDQMRSLQHGQIVKLTTRWSRRSRYGEVHHVFSYGTDGVLVQFTQMKRHAQYGWVGLNRSMVVTAWETVAMEVVA